MDTHPRQSLPTVLAGRYELLDWAGQGGMSTVWKAWDRSAGRHVAVKMPAGAHAGDREAADRLRHEAEMTAAVSHPGVVRVHEYVEHTGSSGMVPALILDYLPEADLQQRLALRRPRPVDAMRAGAQVAAALAAVHARGVVHCDVSAANVVPDGADLKVIDFGIATPAGSAMWRSRPSEILGTPAYLAPERLTDSVARPEMDVYALGVLLYRLLSGRLPWAAATGSQLVAAHVTQEPAPLPRKWGVPAAVRALCGRCLAKDRALRPTAAEVAWLLRRAVGGRGGGLPALGTAPPRRTAGPTCPIKPPGSAARA